MKRTGFLLTIPSLLLAYVSFVGSAQAIVVNEPPDFPDSDPGPAKPIMLDLGLNFVSGNSSHSGGVDPTVDFDDLNLIIQPGHVLESMKFSWTVHTYNDVQSLQTTFTLAGTTPSSRTVTLFDDSGGADSNPLMNMFDLPLGAGSYLLNQLSQPLDHRQDDRCQSRLRLHVEVQGGARAAAACSLAAHLRSARHGRPVAPQARSLSRLLRR